MADDESPQSNERIVPHLDDGYSDGMIGPMFGLQRLSVPAEKLRQGGERAHREGLVGIPWRMILIACGGVAAALLVFGLLVTLPQLGQHSDRYIGVWQGGRGQATTVTIYKAQDGWDVVANGRTLHAIDRDGQLVTTGNHTLVTLRRENDTLVMTRGDSPPVVLARQ